jgi:hypothetical protein
MDIGEQPDAKSVDGGRQTRNSQILLDAHQPMTLVGRAVGEGRRGDPDPGGGNRPQRVTPRHAFEYTFGDL